MEALRKIQEKLEAPKGQHNKFGNYNYRSCEDILAALKPLLVEFEAELTISDAIELIGDRYYVKATVILSDGKDVREVSAYAREAESKKGMDSAQITGAASSYARKYALNGLFAIDDTKDADATNRGDEEPSFITAAQVTILNKLIKDTASDIKAFLSFAKAESLDTIQARDFKRLESMLKSKLTDAS